MTSPQVPPDLKRCYQEGRLIVFVGSGTSTGITWSEGTTERRGVTWKGLVNKAAELLGFGEPDLLRVRGTDLQILEFFELAKGSHTELTNWFLREMNPPEEAIRDSESLSALANLGHCHLYYTTNFDDFLERAFDYADRPYTSVATEKDMADHLIAESKATGVRPAEIVKFHGDLNHPDRMVLSESDYEERLSFSKPEDHRLHADLLGRAVLFVGYSFSDWNVAYLFRRVQQLFDRLPESSGGHRAYITVFDPSDFEQRLFGARNFKVIGLDSRDRPGSVAAFLKELAE